MTASDWGPDSPATTRFRAFYDWPAPVEFEATLPDDLDGPDDERDFLLDAAPFSRQSAVRVEPVVPASTVAQGATNTPDPGSGATASGNDGSGDLRAALGRVIAEGDYSLGAMWSVPGIGDAERIAEVVLKAGYRLVSEDEATVDRVAVALCDFDGYLWPEDGEVEAAAQAGLSFTIANTGYYRDRARAAVRALLGEDRDA